MPEYWVIILEEVRGRGEREREMSVQVEKMLGIF